MAVLTVLITTVAFDKNKDVFWGKLGSLSGPNKMGTSEHHHVKQMSISDPVPPTLSASDTDFNSALTSCSAAEKTPNTGQLLTLILWPRG